MAHLGDKKVLRVFAKHDPYFETGRLGEVINWMKRLGPPTIRCVEWRGEIFAIEGSHRLAAAYHLGLVPKIVLLTPERLGWDDETALEKIRNQIPAYTWLVSDDKLEPPAQWLMGEIFATDSLTCCGHGLM